MLPRYKLVLDSTYLKVNGTYFRTKYIQIENILLVDLTSQSYYPTSLFPKYILSYSTISYLDASSTHRSSCTNSHSSFGVLSQNIHSKNTRGDKLTTWDLSVIYLTRPLKGWPTPLSWLGIEPTTSRRRWCCSYFSPSAVVKMLTTFSDIKQYSSSTFSLSIDSFTK